jgi:CHAT domain-containing protein
MGGLVADESLARLRPTTMKSPLLLSGLALAGANRRADASADLDDGVLTAEEIAGLDLSAAEWVVLSACETGAGIVEAGEGVVGLRRAFEIAGAGTLIMSLWSVNDDATREWMEALYETRFVKGLATAEAVRAASLETLARRRERGESTSPFYWAAFVASGVSR